MAVPRPVRPYLQSFDRSLIHFIVFEAMIRDHLSVISRCLDFLEVDPMSYPEISKANAERPVELTQMTEDITLTIRNGAQAQSCLVRKGGWGINSDFSGTIRILQSTL